MANTFASQNAGDNYWERILNEATVAYVIELANREIGDTAEDRVMIFHFFKYLREHTNYKSIVVMATQWHTFSEQKQVALAVTFAGELHASRFMLLLDYLSYRFSKGELV